ncbi:small GTPase superfamily [Rhizoctonia solani]|nr:small GTPase superfamily [Rhizoctonia solani]
MRRPSKREMSVGKTMMLEHFAKPKKDRSAESSPTLGIHSDISTRFMTAQAARLRVELWDTAGQEKFRSTVRSHYRGANGALLIYNVTSTRSFSACKAWLEDLRTKIDEDVPIMLVGNQIDLSGLREVQASEGKKFANDNNTLFAEISAKEGTGVDYAFQTLVEEVFTRLKKNKTTNSRSMIHRRELRM